MTLAEELAKAKKIRTTAIVERNGDDLLCMLPDGTIRVFIDDAEGREEIQREISTINRRLMKRGFAEMVITVIEWRCGIQP